MGDWIEVSSQTSGSWLYLLALPAVILVAFAVYGRTRPAVSAPMRKVLWILRAVTLAVLLLLLTDPVVKLTGTRTARPLLLALVDTSPSMSVAAADGSSRLDHVVETIDGDFFATGQRVESWGFADEPYRLALDTLHTVQPHGRGTDISRALTTGVDEAADAVGIILFTDGRHNLGDDPVSTISNLGVPVFACAAGEADLRRDLSVTPAETPAHVFAGESFSLAVTLGNTGVQGETVELTLSENGEELSRKQLTTASPHSAEVTLQTVSFQVTAVTPGPHIYRVTAPLLEGEQVHDNNEALVFIRVRQERIEVHLIAASPGLDYTFLRRSLAADSTLLIRDRVAAVRSRAEPLSGEPDVIILLDPDRDLMEEMNQRVAEHVRSGGGLLFVAGPKSVAALKDGATPVEILPFEGFRRARFKETETRLSMTPAGRTHAVTRIANGREKDAASPWRTLPPLPGYLEGVSVRAGAHLLMSGTPALPGNPQGRRGGEVPIIAVGTFGLGRVLATASAAFWRLDFLGAGNDESARTVRGLWSNAMTWLASAGSGGRVRASTPRHIYRTGEEVSIVAEVSDDLLRPESDADVEVILSSAGGDESSEREQQSRFLGLLQPGRYEGRFPGLESGEYSYRVEARSRGGIIGSHEGRFVVVEQTVESSDMTPDFSQLAEIARASGGRFLPPGNCGDAATYLDMSPRLVRDEKTIALWGGMWPLGLLICLLSAEWLLRKRSGML